MARSTRFAATIVLILSLLLLSLPGSISVAAQQEVEPQTITFPCIPQTQVPHKSKYTNWSPRTHGTTDCSYITGVISIVTTTNFYRGSTWVSSDTQSGYGSVKVMTTVDSACVSGTYWAETTHIVYLSYGTAYAYTDNSAYITC